MGNVLIQFLPLALAAIAPGMIMAIVVLLGTRNGLVKAVTFILGKYVVYIGWGILFMLFSDWIAGNEGFDAPSFPVLKVILGILLIVLAFRNLFKESDEDSEESPPKWMTMLEDARIPAFFGAGALLSVVQIRFVILTIAGTILITTAELDTAQNIILLLILAFCMVWDLLLPILVYVLAGSRSTEVLEKMNHWLVKQERWIMFTLLALFGIVLLTAGISELGIFQG